MEVFSSPVAMLLIVTCLFWFLGCAAQTPGSSASPAQTLDVLLQDYAYNAFSRPKTGISYEGIVPSNISGIQVSALRLRSGSLRTRGVDVYKEFQIPTGVVVTPYVERLVLVYQNLGNWSEMYYPLDGYTHLTPVLGLIGYDGTNLTAINLPYLDFRAYENPISIKFTDVKSVSDGTLAKCVWFDLHGLVSFSNVVAGNLCSANKPGHFSIVAESTAPYPSPTPPTPSEEDPNAIPHSRVKKENSSRIWVIVGSVLGGFALIVLMAFLASWVLKINQQKKRQQMETAADRGEALRMTKVGSTKAPAATVTRTQPTIETEFVP